MADDVVDEEVELEDVDLEEEDVFDVAEELEVDELADAEEDSDKDSDTDDDDSVVAGEDEETEALEELEAEELALLDEEAGSVLLVDEAQELRDIRREEFSLHKGAEEKRSDEFVCSSCFMVKRTSQLANKRKLICNDCAA